MIAAMMETVEAARVIDEAVGRWDRRRTDDVRRAYGRIVGDAATPRDHVCLLESIMYGVGVHILPRQRLDEVLWSVETTGCVPTSSCVSTFDPARHFVVLSQPSVVSYLADPEAGPLPTFGPTAMGVAPSFKCSVLWWHE